MNFNHGLIIGHGYSTYYLQQIFKHNRFRGMRHSLSTNTLVLISDHVDSPYEDKWIDGVLHYNGMGLIGDQKINFMQNKTLATSNETDIQVFLFEIFDNTLDKYIFMGKVKLCSNPYMQMQYDEEGNYRKVWIFPLKPLELNGDFPVDEKKLKQSEITPQKIKKTKKLSNGELYNRAVNADANVGSRKSMTNYFQRNIYVAEFAKRRANGICELCENPAPFKSKLGEPFLESHHIEWLSKGGDDSVNNTVALCPNCHRKMHIKNLRADVQKLKGKCLSLDFLN